VRGAGLLIGLDLARPVSAEVAAAALEAGFIVNNPTPERIRLAPPLVLGDDDAEAFLRAWPAILDAADRAAGHPAGDPAEDTEDGHTEDGDTEDGGR
jgi:acetylornithine aminotransferase